LAAWRLLVEISQDQYVISVLQAGQPHAAVISNVTTILRDLVSVLAIILAGVWTYYVFIRGRTFQPRLDVTVTLKNPPNCVIDIGIVRFTLKNIGKTKVVPVRGSASFLWGEVSDGVVKYTPAFVNDDLLGDYRLKEPEIFLEPGDNMNIDVPLNIGDAPMNSGNSFPNVVLVKIHSQFWAGKKRRYQDISVLKIEDKREGYHEPN
jgi:hypothetical protein